MTNKANVVPASAAVQGRASVDLDDLPPADRLGYWVDQICAASAEAECELNGEPDSLRGRLDHLSIGDIAINRLHVSAQTFRRTRAHLSRMREEVFALVQIRSGSAQVEQGDQRIVLRTGDLAINSGLDPGDMHLSDNAVVMLTVVSAALMRVVTGNAHPRGTLLISRDGLLAPLLGGFLHSLTVQPDELTAERVMHLRNGLLSTIAAACAPSAAASTGDFGRLAEYHRARVLAFMRQHLATPSLDVDALARGVGLSVSQIHRLFPSATGSPMRRLWAMRLERACELLQAAQMPRLGDVAWLCGFESQAHFSRLFKQHHGMSPSAYLATHASTGI